MEPFATARIDQAAAELRDDLDKRYPFTSAAIQEDSSPWHDGAAHVVQDLVDHRGDYNQLLLRLWAWDYMIHENCR